MNPQFPFDDATGIALAIRSRKLTAREITTRALEAIRQHDPALNCFTAVLDDSAMAQADLAWP